jgi:hypothetical protein
LFFSVFKWSESSTMLVSISFKVSLSLNDIFTFTMKVNCFSLSPS